MIERDEHVVAILEPIDGYTISENFGCHMEVAENCVAPPHPHQEDGFRVHIFDEQGNVPPSA